MIVENEFHRQVIHAIEVSENILQSLENGDIESAKEYDDERVKFLRKFSKLQHSFDNMPSYNDDMRNLVRLDQKILCVIKGIYSAMMKDINRERAIKSGHAHYAQNQKLG